MSDIFFEYPFIFAFIVPFIFCSRFCKPRFEALIYPHLDIFMQNRANKAYLLSALKWLSVLLALTALASPVRTNTFVREKTEGYSIVLALDASGSMRFGFKDSYLNSNKRASKFDASIKIVREFIQKRRNDALGLVVFGNFAYIASPLTYDKTLLIKILDKLYATIAGSNYTVINDALFQSAKLFEKSKAKSKILILLTDGQSRGDNIPFSVSMKIIEKTGIKVYTIGIGNKNDFNAMLLKRIAKKSGGKFFSANDKDTLKKIYAKIDKEEKSQIKTKRYIKKSYLFELPLFMSFMSLLFYSYILNKKGSV